MEQKTLIIGVIGADVHLYPMVSIRERCRIGDRTTLHNGVVIGADGKKKPQAAGKPVRRINKNRK